MIKPKKFFHLHLVSDATGETLIAASRAVTVQYEQNQAVEHVHPLIRNMRQLEDALHLIERSPGIVLYTLVNPEQCNHIEERVTQMGMPCVNVLEPVISVFQSYLGPPSTHQIGAQHALNKEYFRRIEALNYTMVHDDGQLPTSLNDADIVLLGISRTSKTPTSMYLANRGLKTANIPLVPDLPLPLELESISKPLVVGLIASPDRIMQIRQNRLLGLGDQTDTPYVNRKSIAHEIAQSKKLCAQNKWPVIDVTRRSIEETAAEVLALYNEHSQNSDDHN